MGETIERKWRVFLVKRTLAQQYPLYSAVQSFTVSQGFRNPLLEAMLPGVFLIQAFTIADEALETFLEQRGVTPRSLGLRNDTHGRIESAYRIGAFADAGQLHSARADRNRCAHEAEFSLTWSALDMHVFSIGTALGQLGLRTPVPNLDVAAERVPFDEVDGMSGFRCSIIIYEGSVLWAKQEWSIYQADDEVDP